MQIWKNLSLNVPAGDVDRIKELEARLADLQQTVLLGCMERTVLQQQLSEMGGEDAPLLKASVLAACTFSSRHLQ